MNEVMAYPESSSYSHPCTSGHPLSTFSALQQSLLGFYPDLHLSADVSQQLESASAGFVPCQQTSLSGKLCTEYSFLIKSAV